MPLLYSMLKLCLARSSCYFCLVCWGFAGLCLVFLCGPTPIHPPFRAPPRPTAATAVLGPHGAGAPSQAPGTAQGPTAAAVALTVRAEPPRAPRRAAIGKRQSKRNDCICVLYSIRQSWQSSKQIEIPSRYQINYDVVGVESVPFCISALCVTKHAKS